jgi:tetratricopeptide (TPR) repeat protein
MLVSEIQAARYEQGQTLLDEALARIAQSDQISAEVRALWNQSKARLLARWGEAEERRGNPEKALALSKESMQIMNDTIALWKECLSSALPLNTKRLEFKLGRAYNDYAYRLRLSGNINEAYHAIQKCLEFKQEKNASLPRSLAVAIGEHALILAAMGQLLQANEENAKALSIQQDLLQKGDGTVSTDIGMLLIERGTIFMQQARTVEARPLFAEGIGLIGENNSRRKYRDEAEKQIHIIDASPHYYLDAQWAERYLQLARYDDTEWLSSAGPFSDEEKQEWEILSAEKKEGKAKARMEDIMLQSRQRELEHCFVEQREPYLHYSTIPIATVEEHITGFERLLDEITSQEQHVIVRRLYQKSIQEQLSYLHMYKAIIQKECDRVWHYNQHLFGIPSREEVEIALLPLVRMLVGAQAHPEVGTIATNLLTQIKTWNIHQDIFTPKFDHKREQNVSNERSIAVGQFDKKKVTPEIAKCFFEDILYSFYHFRDWEVCISPTRTMAHVEPSLRRVILPQKEYSIEKLRGLLAEEIETHVFRAEAGYASPLMLLGSGTARYKYTEEALATLAKGEQANPKKSWLGTLAAGLMAGVVNPPFTFSTLVLFLKQAFLVRNIKYEPYREAEEGAQKEALERAVRAVRGIPDLTRSGICCLLDRIYLKGYLDLSDFLKKGGDIQSLFVGKIGTDDLPDMEQIHLLKPAIQQQHLAEQLDIYTHIRKIEKRSIAGNQADNV